ncbi:MAG: iron-containing alcohol dehydrogenase [Planctomycetota bacterium]
MAGEAELLPFELEGKTRIVYGPGVLARLPELVRERGARSVVLVTDRGLVEAGHAERAEQLLASAGADVLVVDDVVEDPEAGEVGRCAEAARAFGVELFVALGGGSAIDTAKGAAMLVTSGGRMQDLWGHEKTRAPVVPMIAIPTTAGTGAEVQRYALVTDEASDQKMACGARDAAPRVALLDPQLCLSMPERVTQHSALDALGHALETAVTKARTPLSDLYAHEAFRLVAGHYERVLIKPRDLVARGAMLLGACWAGLAIEHSMLGAAHSLANPVSARVPLPHGCAVGLMLPHVVRFNGELPAVRARYAELAALLPGGGEPFERLLVFLRRALELAGIPADLHTQGLRTEDLGPLADVAARQWTAQFNPRPVGRAEFERLLTSALHAP